MPYASRNSSVPAHLLMVDDNKMGLQARKAVMEELGYRVTTLHSATDALERLSREQFDIIITDYKMPSMNGTEFILNLRKAQVHTPVVLISGYVDALGLNEKNTGADALVQKSANEIAHMVRAVKTLLRRSAVAKKKPPKSQPPPNAAKRAKA